VTVRITFVDQKHLKFQEIQNLIGKAIDAAGRLLTAGPSPALVHQLLLYCALLVVVTGLFQYARYVKRRYIRDMCFRIRSDMRAGLLERTLARPVSQLEREPVGDLISRTIGDVEQVVSTIENTINEAWDTWLLMVSYLVVLLFYSVRITLICSIPVPLALWLAEAARHPLYRYSLKARQAASRVTAHLHATLNNVALLRLFGREQAEQQRLAGYAEEQLHWTVRTELLQTGMMPIYATLASLGVVGVLGLGSQQVLTGRWTIGAFSAYLAMFLAMSRRTWVAARVFNRWHGAKASWDRIREKLSAADPAAAPAEQTEIVKVSDESAPGLLQVKDLNFSYPSGQSDVLKDISFSVPLGSLVGVTGAFFLGYRFGDRRPGEPAAVGTGGHAISREAARERGAELGARVADAATTARDALSDGAITAKIKSKMALDDTIKSRDIHVATCNAVVTLSGKVGSAAERDRAMQLARETEGVKSVTNELQIAK
jgi:ABC-type multidrug transport system fused ATPase/permease subunit